MLKLCCWACNWSIPCHVECKMPEPCLCAFSEAFNMLMPYCCLEMPVSCHLQSMACTMPMTCLWAGSWTKVIAAWFERCLCLPCGQMPMACLWAMIWARNMLMFYWRVCNVPMPCHLAFKAYTMPMTCLWLAFGLVTCLCLAMGLVPCSCLA